MGLYYNPNPPQIGNQQPLEQRKLTPPQSGPAPQNPPLVGAVVGQAILSCWAIAAAAIILPRLLVPQSAAAATTVPAPRQVQEIHRSWEGQPPAPIVARNLVPPISGPTPQNPPLVGAQIGQSILNSWSTPLVAIALPQATAPQPTQTSVSPRSLTLEIYRAWEPPPPAPVIARNLVPPISGPAPQNPPVLGARIPLAAHVAWLPLPPAPIVAINLDPPIAGPAPTNPPIVGARVPVEVQIAWLPPAPSPIVAVNLDPPIAGPAVNNPPFVGGARVSLEVQVSWLAPAPAPIVGPKFTSGASSTANPPFAGGAKVPVEVQIAWLPPQPLPLYTPARQTLSGPAPQNPPVNGGARISQEIQISSWLAPSPAPIVGPKLTAAQPAPSNPPFVGGARVPVETQIAWLPAATLPIVGPKLTSGAPPSNAPGSSAIAQAVLSAWDATPYKPIVAGNLNPALFAGPAPFPFAGARIPLEVLRSWDNLSPAPAWLGPRLAISGPLPSMPPPGGGARVPDVVLTAWSPIVPAPITARLWRPDAQSIIVPPAITVSSRQLRMNAALARVFGDGLFTITPMKSAADVNLPWVADTSRIAFDLIGTWEAAQKSRLPHNRGSEKDAVAQGFGISAPSVDVADEDLTWRPRPGDLVRRHADNSVWRISDVHVDGMGRTLLKLSSVKRTS